MKSKADAWNPLNDFCTQYGVPNPLVSDNAGQETESHDWKQVIKKFLIEQRTTEPHSPWQDKAESEIKELKKHHRRTMNLRRVPEVLWDYSMEYASSIRQLMARSNHEWRTPFEWMTGDTPDICEYIDFTFHGLVKFWEPGEGEKLGRWLGVARNIEQAMVYYILKENIQVVAQSTVRNLNPDKWRAEDEG